MKEIKLSKYSHGAGCGCKIAPGVLDQILYTDQALFHDPRLLIGNELRDDAAVYDLNGELAVISTTDFFMPIVDDPFNFGAIASVNAISDIYAMGGTPILAISILGWPVESLPPEIAGVVVNGARNACMRAGISLAGGHSIDSPEPIFGLAVTGIVQKSKIKPNSAAIEGCRLYVTKPIGIGILTTAQKQGILLEKDLVNVSNIMLTLNDIGKVYGELDAVRAMTDVTGFGLAGHLLEMCEGSGMSAEIDFENIPIIENLDYYVERKSLPGGIYRNYKSYGYKLSPLTELQKIILCDPQTSGGLLVAVEPDDESEFVEISAKNGLDLIPIGRITEKTGEVRIRIK